MSALSDAFRVFSCEENCGNCLIFESFEELEEFCAEGPSLPDFRADVYDLRDFRRECDRCGKTTRWWA